MDVKAINKLFTQDLVVANMGLESFADNLREQDVKAIQIGWKPPAGGDPKLVAMLDAIEASGVDVAAANAKAVKNMMTSKPVLMDIGVALDDIPGMEEKMFLHAGPPVSWERMSGPTRGAVIGGIIFEGWASTPEEAEKLAASGAIKFDPCHHHSTVGPMAGIVTPSMPVWIVKNEAFGNYSYATLNEGLGKVLRYGAYGEEVNNRLQWMKDLLAPVLKAALAAHGPLDMKNIIAQVLQMGDEGHNRNRAGTSIVIRELASDLVKLKDFSKEEIAEVFDFLNENDHFFLNLSMPTAKAIIDSAHNIEGSTIVTVLARNGTDFGIRVSGLGDEWFIDQAPIVDGLYLPGYTEDDAARDIGDSTITETAGFGGFAMAAAPAIVKFVGGSPEDALNVTKRMYEITDGENTIFQIPILDFRGTPTGINLLKVIESGILPAINTGIAHKTPGIGMVGAGLVDPPMKCFTDALAAFAKEYSNKK